MSDTRIKNFAHILVDYSTQVKPGDRVAIITATAAEPLVQELYGLVLERGGYPHLLLDIADQDKILFAHASDEQLEHVPEFHQTAFEQFDVLLKVRAITDTRALSDVDPARQALRQKSIAALIQNQMLRGAKGELRWMSTLYPTQAYAQEAGMDFQEYQDFVYQACHANNSHSDPVAYWQRFREEQAHYIACFEGHERVEIREANVDLSLSIKGRRFVNACGLTNMPDGEIFTGPVEDSVNGWVRYTYPAIYQGRIVKGIELTFKDGKVIEATAEKEEELLLKMLDTDPGARHVGEFAIGTNYQIDRFTRNILFDEKIGGSFHMALGAGYPETGSRNKSMIHWDMICDLREDSEIQLDGEVVYRHGEFTI